MLTKKLHQTAVKMEKEELDNESLEEDEKQGAIGEFRGDVDEGAKKMGNYIFVYGTEASAGVSIDTNMCKDVFDNMMNKICNRT